MSDILKIASYITQYHKGKPYSVTPMKLQKLLYYIKAWGLVSGDLYIPDKFKKWDYGPVNTTVYHHYKDHQNLPIPPSKDKKPEYSELEYQFIDFILDCYSPLNAISLSTMTHSEDPWINTPKDATISEDKMKSYYSSLAFAKNFPIDLHNKPFHPVLMLLDYSFTTDMKSGNTEDIMVYPSFVDYKQQFENSYTNIPEIKTAFRD
ncbi:DUF4065 domain-containing protein [bacterium]|nr:DUF4065 domain-containing protein [bacterium]